MTPRPETEQLQALLSRAGRRVAVLLVLHGATTAFALAVAIAIVTSIVHGAWTPAPVAGLGLVVLGAVVGLLRARALRPRIAAIIESKAPGCMNLLVTASELIERPSGGDAYVTGLVFRDAARLAASLDVNTLFPLRGALTAVTACAALWTLAAIRAPATIVGVIAPRVSNATSAAIDAVDVDVTEPEYLGGARHTIHDPARIEIPVGSHLHLTVHARGDSVTMETIDRKQALTMAPDRTFGGEILADADGYVALEPVARTGMHGARRLIGISAVADRAPVVTITAPGHDLQFTDGHHTIDLAIDASDDHALATLRLRYTRVSGSGERFTFTEAEVPLTINRVDTRNWKARASWRLDSLALEPGDIVVYRAAASDLRPGAATTESDSYIAEVMAPGGIAAAGFALDPEVERYALSEQMVILKTERLRARRTQIAVDSFASAAGDLAVEQRRVRAEYVFMMGGEVGGADEAAGDLNEEAEAAGEGDLAVQRMLSQGRAALLGAIRAMSRAATALTTPDVALALTNERTALAQLERTFSHTRIILRALTERERIDLTRRLSGTLADASRDERPMNEAIATPRMLALRQALSGIASVAADADSGPDAARRASTLAAQLLRIDPGATSMQRAAAQLDSAATAIGAGRRDAAHDLFDRAAIDLTAIMRTELITAPINRDGDGRLAGALTDALRRAPKP